MSENPVLEKSCQIGLVFRGGVASGRDPRTMTPSELAALGHAKISPVRAIRERCLDCCAGQPGEVRKCVAVDCPSWPFRMGVNPWHGHEEGR